VVAQPACTAAVRFSLENPPVQEAAIYTDGACSGNGRGDASGGWAAVIKLDGSNTETRLSGGERGTTNQRMEMLAAIEGLKALPRPSKVTIYSDSAYLVNCMTRRWYRKWRGNGWITTKREPVANRDLWEELLDLVESRGHQVVFAKVKGHANRLGRASTDHERYNQLCDELAVAATAV
jgi:ribonuclease HI